MWLKHFILTVLIAANTAKTPENLNSKYRVNGEYIIAIDVPHNIVNKAGYANTIATKITALSEKVTIERTFTFNKVIFFVAHCEDELVMSKAYDLPEVRVVEANLKQPAVAQDCQTQGTGSNLWGLSRIGYQSPPDYSNAQYEYAVYEGDDTIAYVVDTGIYINHQDYGGRATRGYTAQNLMISEGEEDLNGHGTHCAGTIIASTYGVAKTASAVAVKVISSAGSYTGTDFLDGVNWMFNDFVQKVNAIGTAYKAVASMSLGGAASSSNDLAVQECVDAGLSVVVAAMNSDTDACNFSPARVADVITVGATDINERLAWYSNWGTCVDILSPGDSILSTFIGNPTAIRSGTSMAVPHVTGAILRHMSQVGFRPSPAAVQNWLISTATENVIDLRGHTSTPNLLLYAPCSMSARQDAAAAQSEDMPIKEPIVIQHYRPGHGHPPGHSPGNGHHPGQGPHLDAHELQEMQRHIKIVYNIAIAAAVLLSLLLVVTIITCCHAMSHTERARAAQQCWYQSNVASFINKQSP